MTNTKNYIPRLICCLLLNIYFGQVCAQSGFLTGRVTDLAGKVLPDVNIILYSQPDTAIANYTKTDSLGNYILNYHGFTPVMVSASIIGYQRVSKLLPAFENGRRVEMNFLLKGHTLVLDEVNIIKKAKISQKGDTTTYDLSSFTNNTERALEEALAKLPGFRVDEGGKVSVNGVPIQKILIDGDDLLDKNYRLLSRNLSAGLVNQVQVLNNFVNNPLLKGLEKTTDVALNISLKDKDKKILIGDASVEGGHQDRYNLSGNAILLGKQVKVYALMNLNNIGNDLMPSLYQSPEKSTSLSIPFEPEVSSSSLVDVAPGQPPVIERRHTILNKSWMQSVNFTNRSIKGLSVRGNMNFFDDKQTQFQRSSTTYNLLEDSIRFDERKSYQKKTISADAAVQLNYQITRNAGLTYDSKVLFGNSKEYMDLLVNHTVVNQYLKTRMVNTDQKLNYTWRIDDRRAFIADVAWITRRAPQQTTIEGYDYSVLLDGDEQLKVNQYSSNPVDYMGGSLKYYRRYDAYTITYTLGEDRYSQRLNSLFRPADDENSNSQDFSNSGQLIKNNLYANLSINRKISRNLELTGKLGLHRLSLSFKDNRSVAEPHFNEQDWSVRPDLTLVYLLSRKSKITLNYNSGQDFPDIQNLSSGYVLTSYRGFTRYEANPNLIKKYQGSIGYRYSDIYNQVSAFLNAYYSLIKNNYADSLEITQNLNLSTKYALDKPTRLFGLLAAVDKFISPLSTTVRLQSNVMRYSTFNVLNNQAERQVIGWTSDTRLALVTAFDGWLNFDGFVQYRWVKNQFLTAGQSGSATNSTWKSFLKADLKIMGSSFVQLSGTRYYWQNNQHMASPVYFFDAGFLWRPDKRKFSLSATVRNLLDKKEVEFSTLSDYQYSSNTYNLLPRMLLLGVKYQF